MKILGWFGLLTEKEHDRRLGLYLEERATREERIGELEDRITRSMQVLSAQDQGTMKGGSGIVIGIPPVKWGDQ